MYLRIVQLLLIFFFELSLQPLRVCNVITIELRLATLGQYIFTLKTAPSMPWLVHQAGASQQIGLPVHVVY